MKKNITGISFMTIAALIVLSSYKEGPATHGWDCTGAETGLQNPTGCTTGGGCHSSSATAGITLTIEIDSAGIPVTHYAGGKSYVVKLTGTNTTSSSLPGFGFQIGCILDSTAQVTPVNAGTWGTPPSQTHYSAPQANNFVVNIVEHSAALTATTGGGATGSTYVTSIPWTAPAAGTGTISFWAALNAVNDNGSADPGDLWNTRHLVVYEEDSAADNNTGVVTVGPTENIKLFPNPVTDLLNLQLDNLQPNTYNISAYNISGQVIMTETIYSDAGLHNNSINTAVWAPGIYLVSLQSGNARQVFKIVKQ